MMNSSFNCRVGRAEMGWPISSACRRPHRRWPPSRSSCSFRTQSLARSGRSEGVLLIREVSPKG